MKLNNKEKYILSGVLAVWGVFLVSSGAAMQKQIKPIIHTDYTLKVQSRKIPEAQAKTNEIKLKDVSVEINNPISVDVRDYLEDVDKIDEKVLKALKLDTSLVNINQAGDYQYTITYKKKKYIGKITIINGLIKQISEIRSGILTDKDFIDFILPLIGFKPNDRPNFDQIYRNKWLNKNVEQLHQIFWAFEYDEEKLIMELQKNDFLIEKEKIINKKPCRFRFKKRI